MIDISVLLGLADTDGTASRLGPAKDDERTRDMHGVFSRMALTSLESRI